MPVIMGTAGHIDHGKTTLVKALTGIDCDRLIEEKKRGITIELGFASLDIGGQILGVIDVPGHERFVKNMVSGAAGIDFVVMVIAADEGVMPQTREHLEICTLLGIEHGLVALTKRDMVDDDWLDLVQEDVRAALKGTFLETAPIIPVSAHTGLGLDELKAEIIRLAKELKPRRVNDLVRIPVDRVFTMKGHGTVITGTMISGKLKLGQDAVVYPKGLTTKIRHLQVHGQSPDETDAGRRTAVNLHGLEVDDLERGDVVALPGSLFPSLSWDVELTCLASSPQPLKHRTEVHFHHGSKEVQARIHLLDRDKLEPGQQAICQMRFQTPMVGVFGDRCVVRSFSPLRTVAGGRIVNPIGRRVRRFSKELDGLARLATATGEDLVATQLDLAGDDGLSFTKLRVMTNVEQKELESMLQSLGSRQRAFLFDREDRLYVSGETAEDLSRTALNYLMEFHKREPMRQGLSKNELATALGKVHPKLAHFLIERLLKKNEVAVEGEVLKLPAHKVSVASDVAKVKDRLLGIFEQGGLTPPNHKDILESLEISAKEAAPILRLLQEEGRLVKIKEDMFCSAKAVEGLKVKVVEFYKTNDDLSPLAFKEMTGLSRKFLIPLLEYLDKEKITMRVGDVRRLRKAEGR